MREARRCINLVQSSQNASRLFRLTQSQCAILTFLHRIDNGEWIADANFSVGSGGGPHNDNLVASVEGSVGIEGGSQWPPLIIFRASITAGRKVHFTGAIGRDAVAWNISALEVVGIEVLIHEAREDTNPAIVGERIIWNEIHIVIHLNVLGYDKRFLVHPDTWSAGWKNTHGRTFTWNRSWSRGWRRRRGASRRRSWWFRWSGRWSWCWNIGRSWMDR
jgi:hypothetical protein